MKKIAITFLILILLVSSGCSLLTSQVDERFIIEAYTATPIPTVQTTPAVQTTPQASLAPTPTPVPVDMDTIPPHSLNHLILEHAPADSRQVVLVTVDGNTRQMVLMDRNDRGLWSVTHGPYEVQLGRNGMGKEAEGDGKSPVGVYRLGSAFGRNGAPDGTRWPWRETQEGDLFIEDSDSAYYNQFVREDETQQDWDDSSDLNTRQYDRAIEVRYNPNNIPGLGSAIFIHVWADRRETTQGCTSADRETLDTLIRWLSPDSSPVLIQMPFESILPDDMVYVIDYAPSVLTQLAFSGDNNPLQQPLEGYQANVAISTRSTAIALAQAAELAERYGHTLLIHEAYRPVQANDQLVQWLDVPYRSAYRNSVFIDPDNYSSGQIVDVTLVDQSHAYLPMGCDYLQLSSAVIYDALGLTDSEYNNRELLRSIMYQSGFQANDQIWWQFSYDAHRQLRAHNFAVK